MQSLIIDATALKQLDILNIKGRRDRQLCTVTLPDGLEALNADVLDDCGKGQTWEHYAALLKTLPVRDVKADELPTEDTPERLWSTQKVEARIAVIPKEEIDQVPKEPLPTDPKPVAGKVGK